MQHSKANHTIFGENKTQEAGAAFPQVNAPGASYKFCAFPVMLKTSIRELAVSKCFALGNNCYKPDSLTTFS